MEQNANEGVNPQSVGNPSEDLIYEVLIVLYKLVHFDNKKISVSTRKTADGIKKEREEEKKRREEEERLLREEEEREREMNGDDDDGRSDAEDAGEGSGQFDDGDESNYED